MTQGVRTHTDLAVSRCTDGIERTLEGVLIQRISFAALVLAVGTAAAPVAVAEPVWPSSGDQSAAATIEDLEGQGYNVQINWVGGDRNQPLSQCSVSAVHNPNRTAEPPTTFTTVYVDVSCPDYSYGPDFGFGIGF